MALRGMSRLGLERQGSKHRPSLGRARKLFNHMNEQNDSTPIHTELHRAPLWQTTLATMRKEGVAYDKTYSTEWLEQRLGANSDSVEFGFAISAIRRELEYEGFYLTARGQSGNGFVILPPEDNADVMLGYQRTAIDSLRRGVILGTNTKLETLTSDERRRHEAVLARLAQRAALVNRKLPEELG